LQIWKVLRQIVKLHGSTHEIALGTAIGVFVAFTPTIGLQMALGIVIATIVGANRIAAALPAWITNPFTIIPIYSFNYWLGIVLVDGPGVDEFKAEFLRINSIMEMELPWMERITKSWHELANLGSDMLLPLFLGCTIVGFACAIPTYPLMKKAVEHFRHHHEHKKKQRHERVLKILKDKLHLGGAGGKKDKDSQSVD
jgi:hypothetical protein